MINAYKAGKDLYATIACGVYKNTYWDNMEHWEDGSPNPEGKKRRGNCKSLLLGIMYGRGVASIAEQIKGTVEEAQKIIDDFYTGFPKVKEWTDKTQADARKTGYVEDLWGRRRRLTDLMLPKYTIKDLNAAKLDFNPILHAEGKFSKKENPSIQKYKAALEKVRGRKEYEKLKEQALKENIELHDNTGFIAQAERQCVNARIQGGAASMTKVAVIKLYNDKILRDLGFKLNIAVHDELIGECPKENADAVADRLCAIMKGAAEDVCDVPFKCDPTVEHCWYFSDFCDTVQKEFKEVLKKYNNDWNSAFNYMVETHEESTIDQLHELLDEIAV